MERASHTLRNSVAMLLAGALTCIPAATSLAKGEGSPESPVVVEGPESPDEVLTRAFSGVTADQVPAGILLERGAVYGAETVLKSDGGEGAEAMTLDELGTAYLDLQRGSYGSHLPSLDTLNAYAGKWRESLRATPISLMLIDYDTISDLPEPDHVNGVLQLPEGELGETRRFAGAVAWVDSVRSWSPTFIVPSDLLVLNGVEPESIGALEVQIGDAPPQTTRLDEPFQPAWLPQQSGTLAFTISTKVKGKPTTVKGKVPFHRPKGKPTPIPTNPPPPPPPPPNTNPELACSSGLWPAESGAGTEMVRFYDLERTVTGDPFTAPWDESTQTSTRGRLSARVIPAGNGVTVVPDVGTCVVELTQPVILVDGFDVQNNRSQDSILQDFGGTIKTLLDLGFDVITVDYQNGRDWIERNGRAFRKFMTVDLQDMVDPDVLQQKGVAVIAGSMGTQVARWGLMEAENNGEEHHARLFINIDGPFFGANIPIGFQAAAVDLASMVTSASMFRASLESPAASQLLLRTFRRGAPFLSTGWYQPRPELPAFFAAASALGGLPGQTRNVASANGSGTGSLQTDLGQDVRLLRAEAGTGNIFGNGRFHVEVRSDGPGARVYERSICKRILFFRDCTRVRLTLGNGLGLDVDAGGYRETTRDFISGVGSTITTSGTTLNVNYSYDIDRHSFVSTASAFGAEGWDNRTWEKCNTEHGTATPTNVGLILSELIAFRDGVTPPEAPLFRTPCDQPEPVENCFPGVVWYADPDNPTYIQPWDDGANCYVTPCPGGYDAEVAANSYAVQPDSLTCFDGGQPVGNGCPYTTIDDSDVIDAWIMGIATLNIEVLNAGGIGGGPWNCPDNTVFIEVVSTPDPVDLVRCAIQPPPGVPLDALYLDGMTIMAPPEQQCSIGVPQFLGGQHLCYLGSAPSGTSAFKFGSSFYYEGWD